MLAKHALSQLSYSPMTIEQVMVGLGRVELPTSPLSGVRSSHLSYRPGWLIINQNVPEPKNLQPPVFTPQVTLLYLTADG